MSDRSDDGRERDAGATFCPQGCHWECEHLRAQGAVSDERAALRPVQDRDGITLMRCGDCGDFLYDVVEHAREHERMRQLGWLPERRSARRPRGCAGRGERGPGTSDPPAPTAVRASRSA